MSGQSGDSRRSSGCASNLRARGNEGMLCSSSVHWVMRLCEFWEWLGCLVISVSCHVVMLSVVNLLMVVVCEAISTMEKSSSKPKSPLSFFFSRISGRLL